MTIQEASKQYGIPIEILQEYESWGLCNEVKKVIGPGNMMIVTLNVSA